MRTYFGILFFSIVIVLVDYSEGTKCWICYQAKSNRECLIRGYVKQCNYHEGCENEVRYSRNRISITKRCKQLQACSNDQFQNSQISNKRYQCGAGRQNSVCRCCCKTDNCNKNQLSCLDQGQPKCPFLFLPNGSTKCYGSSDGISLRTSCRFSCRAGYQVKGAKSTSCIRSGSLAMWSQPLPKCRKSPTCARLYSHSISNGFVRCTGRSGIATLGTSCVFRCKPRYFMVNANKRKTSSNYERTVCTLQKNTPTWSRNPPNCIEEMCPIATIIEHGFAKCTDSNKLGSVCEFFCSAGYDLIGTDKISCIQKPGMKAWTDRPPMCQPKPCEFGAFNKPLLDVECTDYNRFGSVCSVKCRKGYYMSDPNTNTAVSTYTPTCVLKGTGVSWSKTPPKCTPKKCIPVSTPMHGVVKCTGKSQYLSRCSFACPSPIYEISGDESVTCIDDGDSGNRYGVWSADSPTCEFKKCPRINAEATDFRCNDGYVYKSTCTFSCKEGYFMLAPDGLTIVRSKKTTKTTCSLIEGEVVWTRDPPRCEMKRCHELVQPDYGELACSQTNNIASKCSFSCFDGFEMAGKSTLECRRGNRNRIFGKWSAPPPICKRRSCANIYHDKISSALSCSDEFKYESACTLRCNEGYYMRKTPATDVIERLKTTCLYSDEGMTWSARTVACQPKTCEALSELANGTMLCSKELIYNAKCDFSCDRGFDLIGDSSVACIDDDTISSQGKWSSPAPTCEPRKCSPLATDHETTRVQCNKGREYTSECIVSCQAKHFMRDPATGDSIRSMETNCGLDENDNAVWGPKTLTCEPVSCPPIDVPALYTSCTKGNKTGSQCTFSCPIGYDLVGNVTNKCNAIGLYDASWKFPLPFCKVRFCPALVTNEGLDKTCTLGTDYKSVCSITCERDMGLIMTEDKSNKLVKTGESIRRCEIDKRGNMYWTGKLSKCSVKFCLVRRNPKNGKIRCTSASKYKSECTYICNRGFRRVGPRKITCTEGVPNYPQGKWTNKPATCRRGRG